MKILCINTKPDLSFFTQRGFNFEVEYRTITEKFPTKYLYEATDQNGNKVKVYSPDCTAYLEANYKTYQYAIILLGYNPADYPPEFKNTGGYSFPNALTCGTFYGTVRQDNPVNNIYPIHELMHLLGFIINIKLGDHVPKDYMDFTPVGNPVVWKPYYLNDFPDAPDGNFALTWNNYKKFIPQLQAITYGYKYFSQAEVTKWQLKPALWQKLDEARGYAGVPFKITSGLRTTQYNEDVGGAQDSSHLRGLGCDLSVVDSESRYKVITALLKAGFHRIGVYGAHVHCDIDPSLPANLIWHKPTA